MSPALAGRPSRRVGKPVPLAALVGVALLASPVLGQVQGLTLPSSGTAPPSSSTSAFSTGTGASSARTSVGVNSGTVGDAGGLLGLKEPTGGRQALTLDDAIAEALDQAPDARIATERVVQQSASLRRAWALLLPSLTAGAAYTHTCTGGERGVDCGDRVAAFNDPEAAEQQSLLFQSLADVMGIAADASQDPDDAARFRAQQADLQSAADDIKNADTTPVVVQPASQLSGQLTFSLPILNPRAYPALLNAYDGVEAAELARDQARQTLVVAVVRGYYAAVTAQRLKVASQAQVDVATAQKDAVAARVAASTQPLLAQKRAELELLRARQTLAQASAAEENALAAVGALLGRTEAFALVPPPIPADDDVAPLLARSEDELVDRALTDRLEVRTQKTAVQIAERGVVEAWMQFLPQIGLSATARVTSFTQGFVRDPVTGVVTLSATLPLYDGGQRYASLTDASSRTSEERVRLQQIQDRVAAQVRGNLREVRLRSEAHALSQEALVVAKEAQTQAQALFDAGVGTALDITETSFAVFSAETDALRAELDVAMAALGLRWALGEPLQGQVHRGSRLRRE